MTREEAIDILTDRISYAYIYSLGRIDAIESVRPGVRAALSALAGGGAAAPPASITDPSAAFAQAETVDELFDIMFRADHTDDAKPEDDPEWARWCRRAAEAIVAARHDAALRGEEGK